MSFEDENTLRQILVEHWENAFEVKKEGSNIAVYVEMEDTNEVSGLWDHVPMKVNKKDVIIYKVPTGFLDVFIRTKSKK